MVCIPEQTALADGRTGTRPYVLRAPERLVDRVRASPRSGGALPCLNSNICTKAPLAALRSNHRKTAFALAENVTWLCEKYGIERVGFLTLTFADNVRSPKEAQRRYRSLRFHVLKKRYVAFIKVFERQKSGRIHYHLLVVLRVDVRTGFSFAEADRGIYRSANGHLRSEWAFWRVTAPRYGFGRTELLPVKKTEQAIGRYVGKYIAKHIESREDCDKGVRLVDYSAGWKTATSRFAWNSGGSWCWRAKLRQWAVKQGAYSFEQLRVMFGPRWAYKNREAIADQKLSWYPTGIQARADGVDVPIDCTDVRCFSH